MTTVVTPQQIEEWKKAHGQVHEFEADGKICYLKKPTRDVIRAANTAAGDDTIKWNEIVIRNCWLGGDECFQTEDDYFFGLSKQLGEIVKSKQVELKKTY